MKNNHLQSVILASTLCLTQNVSASELVLNLSNIKSAEGFIRISLFSSEESFQVEPSKSLKVVAVSPTMKIRLDDIPAGTHAVLLYHDINGNEELDRNLTGVPVEPWGGSLNGKALTGPPEWDHFTFVVEQSATSIDIAL